MVRLSSTIEPDAAASSVGRFANAHLLKWELMETHSLRSILRDGETYYFTTGGSCDCGTSIGALRDNERPEPDYERKRTKLKKKGWSDRKIERWIEDKRLDLERREHRSTQYLRNTPIDVHHWLEFISEVLNVKAASYIGLLKHWYEGLMETERINVVERRWTPLNELDHDYLLRAEENVIHAFYLHEYVKE